MKKKGNEIELQRLRIPGGWEMVINKLLDVDVREYDAEDSIWIDFTQDILYLKRITTKKEERFGLDLGWYPDIDPEGEFCLKVIVDDDFINPIERFTSRNKDEIVKKIEEYLVKLNVDNKENEIKLQGLKFRGGWQVVTNRFLEVDAREYDTEDLIWKNFTQDILYLKRSKGLGKQRPGLALGWYPENDPNGEFCLKVIVDDDFINPIEEFTSRDKDEIVKKIEEYLLKLKLRY